MTSHHCLADVTLIPPCDRIVLEMAFTDLNQWTLSRLRDDLISATNFFKQYRIKPTSSHVGDKNKA